jgi:hypothetical protein
MEKPPDETPIKNLRDAYKVPGFRVRATLDSYEHKPPACMLTLDRLSKKACAADVGKATTAFTINAGVARGTSAAATAKSISIFKCAASIARLAA